MLIELLGKDKDGQVRLAVLELFAAMGPAAARVFLRSCKRFVPTSKARRSEASHQDYRAALALAAIGKPAVEGLRGLLKEPNRTCAPESAMALGRIGPTRRRACPI